MFLSPSLKTETLCSLGNLPPGGRGGGLPYENVGDAHLEFLFWTPRGTKKGVVKVPFDP